MSGDRTKLPKWAQREIDLLERRLEETKSQIERTEGGETDVFFTTGARMEAQYLPDGVRVVFGEEIEVFRDNYGNVRVGAYRHGRLTIIPEASNCIRVSREVDSVDRYRLMRDDFEDAGLWTDAVEDVAAAMTGMPDHLRCTIGGRADLETEYQERERKRREAKEARA